MKCKDCYARNGEEICLIGKKSRMLVCGHYGCDLQAKAVEKRMGIEKPLIEVKEGAGMDEKDKIINDLRREVAELRAQIRPHGRWIWDPENMVYRCSCCGETFSMGGDADTALNWPDEAHYCISCGAKMED